MTRDDWMLFTLTFLTGIAIGMYVYLTVFKPVYAPENLNENEASASDWSIVSKKHGPDYTTGTIEASFRLLKDGSYVYIPGGDNGTGLEPVEGKLSRSLTSDLDFSAEDLNFYSQPSSNGNCDSMRGGFDYEYRITLNGNTTVLDTCTTMLGKNSALAQNLEQIWNYLGGTDTRTYNSAAEWVEAWISQHFGLQ